MSKYKEKILNSLKQLFKIRYGVFILTALIFILPHSVFADVSQLDYSTKGPIDGTYKYAFAQPIGKLTGSDIHAATIRIYADSTGYYDPSVYSNISMYIMACQEENCIHILHTYEAFTGSNYMFESIPSYPTGVWEGTVTQNFQYTKDEATGSTTTNIPIDPSLYYLVYAYPHLQGGVSLEGSASGTDPYPDSRCSEAYTTLYDPTNMSVWYSNPCQNIPSYAVSDIYYVVTSSAGSISATFDESPAPPPSDGKSQIISFLPADGTTTSSTSVFFDYKAYIAPGDIGFWLGKQMTFYVQHQPIGDPEYFLDKVQATTSGYFEYSTTTVLTPGNYIVNAILEDSEVGGLIGGLTDIFDISNSTTSEQQYHQFVVGNSTFVGNLFQNGVTSVQQQLNTLTATSSTITLGNYCNPFSGFDIVQCFYALLIPTSGQMQDSMNSFYSDFLTRVPWGYGSVAVADLLGYGNDATTSLSSSNLTIVLPNTGIFATATSTSVLKGKTLTFIDWTQMSSTTVQNYWAPALTPLNNFLNIMMGGGFIFWLYHFFKKMRP